VAQIRFTDLAIEKLKTESQQTRYFDTALSGFGIVIGKRRKTFFLMHGTKRQLTTLGHYPSTTLKSARQAALRLIDGIDTVTDTLTASKAVLAYMATHQGSARWKYDLNYHLTRHLLSKHDVPLNEITPKDILTITDSLAATPSEQLHAHRAMSAFFNWAVHRQLLQISPLANLPLPSKPRKRDRVLSYDELAKIWKAAGALGYFGAIIQLCILLGQRRGEISKISISNYGNSILTIPASSTKTRREHSLPLTSFSLELVKNLKSSSINWAIKKAELDALSGVTSWVIHDTRRTFATNLAELGVEPHIIERLLNHVSGQISGVAAIYNRFKYEPQMRAALDLYEAELRRRGVIC
jgi:integrase